MSKYFIMDRKHLGSLTPEERKMREAEISRAKQIAKELEAQTLTPAEANAQMMKRLRESLPDEERKEMERIDSKIATLMIEDKTAEAEQDLTEQQKKLQEWKRSGEAPIVQKHFETMAKNIPFMAFVESTGITATKEAQQVVDNFSETGYLPFVLSSLKTMKQLSFLTAIGDKYTAGEISDPVMNVLSIDPEMTPGDADPLEYISVFYAEHKELLTPYQTEIDIEDNWFAFTQKFVIAPFQQFEFYGIIDNILDYLEQQKAILEGQIRGVFETAFKSKSNPLKVEQLEELADLLKRPKLMGKEFYVATVQPPAAYIQVKKKAVHDLRPYREELQELFTLTEAGFVYDFAEILRRVIKDYKTEKALKTTAQKPEKVEYPLDKINSGMWKLLETDSKKQLAFAVEKMGSGKEISIIYAIDFDKLDGIKITKKLTAFDKRVYISASALWNAGNRIITLTQIHYAMGNTQKPSKNQLLKINDSVTKMTKAGIYVDNAEELENKYNYPKLHYDGALLPVERMTVAVNGQLSDAAIHLFREPPMMTFAKQRGQITTLDAKLLQSPVSKTDSNLALDDYLLERISMAKNKENKEKKKPPSRRIPVIKSILLETLYAETGITTRYQKSRTPEKIKKYLEHYVECNLIKSYVLTADKITFDF